MNCVSAIVLAAGRGLRFSRPDSFTVRGGIPTRIIKMVKSGKSKISKPLIEVNSKPIIIYSLDILSSHPLIKEIIVTANADNLESITSKIKQYPISKHIQIVKGGMRRQDSVYCGLKATYPDSDLVLIHDADRPFINKRLVSCVIREATRTGAAIVGVPVRATIKEVTSYQLPVTSKFIVKKTLNRNNLWEIQTPQVFKKDLILKAYKKFGNIDVTDDSMLAEKLGVKVSVVLGSYNNIKITTPEDFILAEAILKAQSVKRKA